MLARRTPDATNGLPQGTAACLFCQAGDAPLLLSIQPRGQCKDDELPYLSGDRGVAYGLKTPPNLQAMPTRRILGTVPDTDSIVDPEQAGQLHVTGVDEWPALLAMGVIPGTAGRPERRRLSAQGFCARDV